MIVHVLRKPLTGTVAANALQHGCGALNIDQCRVGTYVNTTPSGVDRRNEALAEMGYRPNAYPMGPTVPSGIPGRWPANLILSHLPECEQVGTKIVRSKQLTAGNRTVADGKGWGIQSGGDTYVKGTGAVFAGDGTETVPDWHCAAECPTLKMPEQRPGLSGGGAVDNWKTGNEVIPTFNRKPSAPFLRCDSGPASRFFQQVKSPQMTAAPAPTQAD